MGIEIRGGDVFKNKVKELRDFYPEILDSALDDTADAISLGAQRIVPVDTGRLRASINIKRKKLKKTIGTNVEYAAFVEFGSPTGSGPNGGPKPYLRPAFQNNKDKVSTFFIRNLPQ